MNTSIETCPPLEDLAAFLDGRLSGDERNRVVAHLADCPRCYEVFAETARFQLYEEEGKDKDPPEVVEVPKKVVPFPRRLVFRWVPSIAAVLAVSLAAIPLYKLSYKMPEVRSAELVNPAVAGTAARDTFWDQFNKRGGQDASLTGVPHSVLLGAHAFDLHLSLGRDDRKRALDDLAEINTHIGAIGLLPDQAKDYAAIQKQIDEGHPPKDFLQKSEQIEASLSVEDDPYIAFGKWLEAGRLAALAEDPHFFQTPESRQFPKAFHHQERENLAAKVATPLVEIKEILASSEPPSLPYEKLGGLFEKILTYYQEQSAEPEPD